MRFARFLYTKKFSDGELVGSIAYFAGQSSAPDGWVLCDGSTVSRDTYATLFSAVGATYGAGDGSTTFALPNLIDKFVEGSATVGTSKGAGLPNITGNINNGGLTGTSLFKADGVYTSKSGALYPTTFSGASLPNGSGTANDAHGLGFDASKSNSIYGNSNTVQPPALTMKPFIYTGKTSQYKWLRTA